MVGLQRFGARMLGLAIVVAGSIPAALAGGAHSLYVVDANSGATLADQDGNEPRYPASLTKMMTLYMAFEAMDSGKATPKTRIKISQAAANAQPSRLELPVGDDIALDDAILALITKSANDIAIAIAEHLGGTEANFAKMMTAKARELGMKNTTFKNASGLPDSSQTTTARDMVTLGLHLYDDHPRYFPLFATKSFAYNGRNNKNHNTLMLQMPGINGIKTGYTHASGFNLVSSLEQDGKHVIAAIFGGESAASRNYDMKVALTKALAKASHTKTRKPVLVAAAKPAAPVAAKKPPVAVAAVVPKAPPVAAPVAPSPMPHEQMAVAPTAAPAPGLKVDVAKVRPVMIASATSTPRLSDLLKGRVGKEPEPAAQVATAPPAPNVTPVAAAPAAPSPTATAPVAAVRPPSTLGAQLAQLVQPTATPAAPPAVAMAKPTKLKGPDVREAKANASGGYEIQIGAYASPAEADKKLAAALAQMPGVLSGHTPTRQTITVADKTLHRARFMGFDAASAAAACAELMRQQLNCLAVKAE